MNTLNITATKARSDAAREASELQLNDRWDSTQLHELIRKKTRLGRPPAFLFLGQAEAKLLRRHLGAVLGAGAVEKRQDPLRAS